MEQKAKLKNHTVTKKHGNMEKWKSEKSTFQSFNLYIFQSFNNVQVYSRSYYLPLRSKQGNE